MLPGGSSANQEEDEESNGLQQENSTGNRDEQEIPKPVPLSEDFPKITRKTETTIHPGAAPFISALKEDYDGTFQTGVAKVNHNVLQTDIVAEILVNAHGNKAGLWELPDPSWNNDTMHVLLSNNVSCGTRKYNQVKARSPVKNN